MSDRSDLIDEARLAEDVDLEEERLDEHMRRHSAAYAYWTAQYAEAIREHADAKHAYELVQASALLDFREEARDGGTKVTVDEINAAVMLRPEVDEAYRRVIEADAVRMRLRGVVQALDHKRETMQSLGAKRRLEMELDPAVRVARWGPPQ